VLLLQGEKPIFGPLSKNNTGMAVLRAGLLVIIQSVTMLLCAIAQLFIIFSTG